MALISRARARGARRWRRELGGGVRQHPGSNNCVRLAVTRTGATHRARRFQSDQGCPPRRGLPVCWSNRTCARPLSMKVRGGRVEPSPLLRSTRPETATRPKGVRLSSRLAERARVICFITYTRAREGRADPPSSVSRPARAALRCRATSPISFSQFRVRGERWCGRR